MGFSLLSPNPQDPERPWFHDGSLYLYGHQGAILIGIISKLKGVWVQTGLQDMEPDETARGSNISNSSFIKSRQNNKKKWKIRLRGAMK